MTIEAPAPGRPPRAPFEHRFYTGMAIAAAVVVFVGFSPTFLMCDLGIVPVDTVEARACGEQGNATPTAAAVALVTRTLTGQLAELGYRPPDITDFAYSHAHVDQNAKANLFARSTGKRGA